MSFGSPFPKACPQVGEGPDPRWMQSGSTREVPPPRWPLRMSVLEAERAEGVSAEAKLPLWHTLEVTIRLGEKKPKQTTQIQLKMISEFRLRNRRCLALLGLWQKSTYIAETHDTVSVI